MSEAQNTKYGYMAVRSQSDPKVPVIPSTAVARIDGDIMKNSEIVKNSSIQNIYNNASAIVEGNTTIEGSINMELSPIDAVWYFRAALGSLASTDVSSLTDGSVYRHDISHGLCALPSLCIEQKTGGCGAGASQPDGQDTLVKRAFGNKVDSLELSIEEGILKLSTELKAYGAFDVAFLSRDEDAETAAVNISGATWANGIITFTSAASHTLAINDIIKIASVVPTAYNGYYKVITAPTSTTFTVAKTSNPGTYTSGGTVAKISMFKFGTGQVKGLVAGDSGRLYESVGKTYETVTLQYVDEANDTLGFDSITSTAFTVANNTKFELVQQTISYSEPVLFGFKNVKVRVGDTISEALTNDAYDLSTMKLELANNVETKFGTEYNTNKETGGDYTMELSLLFRDLKIRDLFRARDEQAMVIEIDNGQVISATDTNNQAYKIVIKLYRFVYEADNIETPSGGLIEESATGLILHSYSDGKSIDVQIYNNKAGTYYTA